MNKIFEFGQIERYYHSIEVNIPESMEGEYEKFADSIANQMIGHPRVFGDAENIVIEFERKFGAGNVKLEEDACPSVEFTMC